MILYGESILPDDCEAHLLLGWDYCWIPVDMKTKYYLEITDRNIIQVKNYAIIKNELLGNKLRIYNE